MFSKISAEMFTKAHIMIAVCEALLKQSKIKQTFRSKIPQF